MRIAVLVLGLAACSHPSLPGPDPVPPTTDFAGDWRVTLLHPLTEEPLFGGIVRWRLPDWKSADATSYPHCSRCWVGTSEFAVAPGSQAWLPETNLAWVEVDHGKATVSFGMMPGRFDDGHLVAALLPDGLTLRGRAFRAGIALMPAGRLILERIP